MDLDRRTHHLENLRRWRGPRRRDLTLADLPERVERTVLKPHRQLGAVAMLWRELVPGHLLDRTALVSFQRGVLTVELTDSATLYELDRLLRCGLERQLRTACKTTLRRVRCRIANSGSGNS